MTLPDDTQIFPAHGAGSVCGRQMSSESSSAIGKQRQTNYALLARTSEDFVHLLTDNLPGRPEYFAREVDLNRRGVCSLSDLQALVALTAPEVLRLQKEGAVVVDTRPAMHFAVAHVPGSVHIALTGQYASWAARILGLDTPLMIAGEDPEHVRESQMRLARVGIENVIGYLADGVHGWIKNGFELDFIPQITVQDFVELRAQEPRRLAVLDVREPGEVSSGRIDGSGHIPLGQLRSRAGELDRDKLLVVYCRSGFRSSIATSLLRRAGIRDIANLTGGFDAWKAAYLTVAIA
jgi:rhodanese-related sulfurtransferase